VVSGGGYAYAVGGVIDPKPYKGYLVAVEQQHVGAGALDVWAEITSGTASTWLVAEALCAPVSKPAITMTQPPPSGVIATRDISYAFTATDQAGEDLIYQCSRDSAVAAPCTPGATNTITGLSDGGHSLVIGVRNDSFQWDTKSFSFVVDTTPPTVSVAGEPADPTSATSAAFTITATDVHPGTTFCHLDAEAEQACPSPASYTDLADGVHTFSWRATDAVGNQSTGSYTWRVDTVAPTAALAAPKAQFAQSPSATVKWSGSDVGSGVASWQVQWQRAPYNGDFGAWSSPASYAPGTLSDTYGDLARGYDYCYRVRSVDGAGNASAYSPSRCTSVLLDDRSLATSAGWARITGRAYYAGTATTTKHHNATLKRTGAHLDRIAMLATKCAACGRVGVYVNGELIGTVNLHASSTHNRQLIKLAPFSYRTGTVTLKTLTSGKLVRIDGLGISRT
jgi:hypothetical protein